MIQSFKDADTKSLFGSWIRSKPAPISTISGYRPETGWKLSRETAPGSTASESTINGASALSGSPMERMTSKYSTITSSLVI